MVTKHDGTPVLLPATADSPASEVIVNFRRTPDSSNVLSVGWDAASNMYIHFASGATWVYMGVSRQRAVATAYAASVGSYVNKRIKGKFDAVRIA